VLRLRDLRAQGVHPEYVRRLVHQGFLTRIGWGLYVPTEAELTSAHTVAEATKRVPQATVCLLSALQLHGIGTQLPRQVWLAIDRKSRLPNVGMLPIRFVRFSGQALSEGIEERTIEGIQVRLYCPAKTVADCFKYRNKIGMDVALEALRECRRGKKCSADQLWRFAQICRVANVMRPYLEATA
jgi:predicted transcriptional regulator of viral defense system